jgi:hypothetical protein
VPEDDLRRWYEAEGLSTWEIEKRYGYSRSASYRLLKQYGIPIRSIAESHTRYPRKSFEGDAVMKAYLLGFAIGDLRMRHHNGPKSATISIACGTTSTAQIALIRDLFEPYGRVWVGRPNARGVMNIEAFVDHSFSFLLRDRIEYVWVAKDEHSFFSFLAGFTDAEGSYFFTKGRPRLSWGNYDYALLVFLREQLIDRGFRVSSMTSDHLAGYVSKEGYVRRQNYWHFTCAAQQSLLDLVSVLRRYTRHSEKLHKCDEIKAHLERRI